MIDRLRLQGRQMQDADFIPRRIALKALVAPEVDAFRKAPDLVLQESVRLDLRTGSKGEVLRKCLAIDV